MARESKKSPEQLEKERNERHAKLMKEASVPLDEVLESAVSTSEREFGKKFKEIYVTVRKGLVHLDKQKRAKIKTNEEVFDTAVELLNSFIPE